MIDLKERYVSEEECRQAIAEYNKDKQPDDEMRYCSYYDSILRKRFYIPCTVEYFHAWRNMMAEEHRLESEESRCLVPSERYSYLKRCHEDCSKCPYGKDHRDGKSISLDKLYEDYEYEIPDPSQESPLDNLIKREREEALKRELSLLDEESQKLLNLFNDGLSDDEIGKAMGLKRSTVQYKKSQLIKLLQEKLKNFLD